MMLNHLQQNQILSKNRPCLLDELVQSVDTHFVRYYNIKNEHEISDIRKTLIKLSLWWTEPEVTRPFASSITVCHVSQTFLDFTSKYTLL